MAARKSTPKRKAQKQRAAPPSSRPQLQRTRSAKHVSRPRGGEPAPLKFAPRGDLAEHYRRVLEIAERFPGVEATRAYGSPCIKVDGKIMARLRSESEGGLALRCDFPERQMLMQADPRAFYLTDHYLNWPMVLINLAEVRWAAMPGLIEAAWRMVAKKKRIAEFDESNANTRV
jgi:hypothetical protein